MAKRRRDTTGDSASTAANGSSRRGRQAAPSPTIIRLHQDLEPNENHPLNGIDPARREEQRRQLFASILARLANGPGIEASDQSIMKETDPTEDERHPANDGEDR